MPKISLQTKLGFNLNLTPLLKNSIKLLSMPYVELLSEVNQALENNMLLTENQTKTTESSYYSRNQEEVISQISSKPSLFSSLESQLRNANLTTLQHNIAQIIFENITEKGFLEVDIAFIARIFIKKHSQQTIDNQDCEQVRQYIQNNFEPLGVASLSVQDFLLLQLNQQSNIKHKSLFVQLLLAQIDLDAISPKQRNQFLALIKTLSKTPVDNFDNNADRQYIQTDIAIEKEGENWHIHLRTLPSIAINKKYLSLRAHIQDKTLFNEHLMAARSLISFLSYRNQFLQLITKELIVKQTQALTKGLKYLTPLTQKQLAIELNIGESTLSRLIKNRYMDTPIGTIRIKDLFSSNVGNYASKSVQQIIKSIIQRETKPLSDQKITNLLIQKNINISRRTVTKYRKTLNIPCAKYRKLAL
ncbi:hypothetical protein MS2017_2031 [Bathymodiolus thermophilus thioautotrophic gill symbiont]|uniref:RNA polymerase sigma-54 factor n=1 Tax=Bathymodiolus thermophilus thioautotrophic gill symbiont TaxID=2360 RepID=A0A3G3IPS0_9GAMM|nr:hypothetical protein [Bathymodiolus thermophilus thioautotrophic gill symbiont]AYQ57689.1 hypothetical protein MS2017_2031 [Bathymodiolus thermophilus thioautotrophic gill symbiont]